MLFEPTQEDRKRNEQRYAAAGLWIAFAALFYPLFLFALARVWWFLWSRELSAKTQAWLTLLIFPVILGCALSFVLALRGRGWRRTTTIVCSILAAVVNLFTFLGISITY